MRYSTCRARALGAEHQGCGGDRGVRGRDHVCRLPQINPEKKDECSVGKKRKMSARSSRDSSGSRCYRLPRLPPLLPGLNEERPWSAAKRRANLGGTLIFCLYSGGRGGKTCRNCVRQWRALRATLLGCFSPLGLSLSLPLSLCEKLCVPTNYHFLCYPFV